MTIMQVNPSYNYLIADQLALGATLPFQLETSDDFSKNMGYGIGPQLTWFLNSMNDPSSPGGVSAYLSFSYMFLFINSSIENKVLINGKPETVSESEYNFHSQMEAIGLGIIFMLSQSVGLITEISFSHENRSADSYEYNGRKLDYDFSKNGNSINLLIGLSAILH